MIDETRIKSNESQKMFKCKSHILKRTLIGVLWQVLGHPRNELKIVPQIPRQQVRHHNLALIQTKIPIRLARRNIRIRSPNSKQSVTRELDVEFQWFARSRDTFDVPVCSAVPVASSSESRDHPSVLAPDHGLAVGVPGEVDDLFVGPFFRDGEGDFEPKGGPGGAVRVPDFCGFVDVRGSSCLGECAE
jgi:hypothetical protein